MAASSPVTDRRPGVLSGGSLGTVLQPGLAQLRRTALDPFDESRPLRMRQAWQRLCDVGVAGILAPERSGGQGGGVTEAVEVARALSRLACPVPFLSSAVLATRLGEAVGASTLLAELTTGDRVAAVTGGGTLRRGSGGTALSGSFTDVLHGAEADVWLVAVPEPGGRLSLAMLERPDYDVVPTADPTRPVVQATLRELPAALLHEDCGAMLLQAGLLAEIVRCAEVLAAAESVLSSGRAQRLLLRTAVNAVDLAACAADVDGSADAALVRHAASWTARVSASVGTAVSSAVPRRFHLLRAQQASGWRAGSTV